MRLYIKDESLNENSKILPYLAKLSRKEPCKFYADERADFGFIKFNKLSLKNGKNDYKVVSCEDDKAFVGATEITLGDFLDIGMFDSIPKLDRDGSVKVVGESIVHSKTNKVLATVVENFDEAVSVARISVVALCKIGTEAEGLISKAFDLDDEKMPRWLDKFATMDNIEYDYILNLQRNLLCKKKDFDSSYDIFIEALLNN